ncbi:uncharacterized protein [Gossypium hirsutum]|uniref:RNase H type-1 domain-containing protein n=1 Tax=Gossypium hirsutum TaxID=3635 RepID=A0A1U8LPN9_GOSHI|nr:uncharacterized protein LOC107928668 [Gossypium hirsutum]
MGIRAAIELKIRVLEVYGDSALVIYQLKGECETRDPKLINYRELVRDLIKVFDDITFFYLPRDENQMADALDTLASMIRVNGRENMKPIQMCIYEAPAHCCNIDDEEERDDYPWYHDILRYVKNREYPDQGVDVVEVKKILEEVHEDVGGTHANGFTVARKIMRFRCSGLEWGCEEGEHKEDVRRNIKERSLTGVVLMSSAAVAYGTFYGGGV